MKVTLRTGMKTVRHIPAQQVDVPGELPLISPEDPDSKQIQEVWTARVRVFRLKSETDQADLTEVWQRVTNQQCRISENITQWCAEDVNFVVFLRWSDISYVAPTV